MEESAGGFPLPLSHLGTAALLLAVDEDAPVSSTFLGGC